MEGEPRASARGSNEGFEEGVGLGFGSRPDNMQSLCHNDKGCFSCQKSIVAATSHHAAPTPSCPVSVF